MRHIQKPVNAQRNSILNMNRDEVQCLCPSLVILSYSTATYYGYFMLDSFEDFVYVILQVKFCRPTDCDYFDAFSETDCCSSRQIKKHGETMTLLRPICVTARLIAFERQRLLFLFGMRRACHFLYHLIIFAFAS